MDLHEDNLNIESTAKFTCPSCGDIAQDDVIFLCNRCERSELIYKDGIYICPACLKPGENFECMKCGSKDVVMEEGK